MKPVCDITLREGYQHTLRDHPTQLTNPEAVYKAKSNQLSYPQNQYLKNSATSKAEQLVPSKAYPSPDIHSLLSRHARL